MSSGYGRRGRQLPDRRQEVPQIDARDAKIMIPRFDAETVLRAIGEHRATLMDGVPTAYY